MSDQINGDNNRDDNGNGFPMTIDKAWVYKLALAAVIQTFMILGPILVTYTVFKTSVELALKSAEEQRTELKIQIKDIREDLKKIPFPFDEAARKKLDGHERRINRLELLRSEDERTGRLQTTEEKYRQHGEWHKRTP